MIKHEYLKAVDDYSKLFHFFDQSRYVLDLLNLAYEKYQLVNKPSINNQIQALALASPTASFIQPAVFLSMWSEKKISY